MATPSIGAPRPAAAPAAELARTSHTSTQAPTSLHGTASAVRQQQNAQILQASMDVSIQSGSSSMALLYRSAIDRINEQLAPELGPNAIAGLAHQDNSPEGTAGRILAMSTAFYDAYAARHKDQDPETVARNFVDLIRGGFERGFGEARDILSSLGVLGAQSPIEQGIQKTHGLVMQGFDDFLASKLPARTEPAAPDSSAA